MALVALPGQGQGQGQGEDAVLLANWRLPLRRLSASDNEWAPVWAHPTLLAGRGDTLHLIDDGIWNRCRGADLLASV